MKKNEDLQKIKDIFNIFKLAFLANIIHYLNYF